MGHSTGSGRNGSRNRPALSADQRKPRGVAENSRLGRNWREAQRGNASVVVREYDQMIRAETVRMREGRNAFVREAARQAIEKYREEKRRIERAFLD